MPRSELLALVSAATDGKRFVPSGTRCRHGVVDWVEIQDYAPDRRRLNRRCECCSRRPRRLAPVFGREIAQEVLGARLGPDWGMGATPSRPGLPQAIHWLRRQMPDNCAQGRRCKIAIDPSGSPKVGNSPSVPTADLHYAQRGNKRTGGDHLSTLIWGVQGSCFKIRVTR